MAERRVVFLMGILIPSIFISNFSLSKESPTCARLRAALKAQQTALDRFTDDFVRPWGYITLGATGTTLSLAGGALYAEKKARVSKDCADILGALTELGTVTSAFSGVATASFWGVSQYANKIRDIQAEMKKLHCSGIE